MTTNPPTNAPGGSLGGGSNGSAYASASSVAGLAREIDALRQDLARLLVMPARLDELAGLVAQLAEATAAISPPTAVVASWLDLPTEPDTATAVLTELIRWLETVYLRYPDAAAGLPECWLWHPEVIEELLWLHHAWTAAYHDDHAPATLAGDWHDRYRPGVVRRITSTAGRCSLENHQPREDRPTLGAPVVPLATAADVITSWWATRRHEPAPQPAPDHLASASALHRPGSRR